MAKIKKVEVSKEKPKWTVFKEGDTTQVDRLYRIYHQDHKKAKVIYTQNKNKYDYTKLVLFEWSNGDFKICSITKTYGISSSNIIYHREKTTASIMYKKNGNKFYYIDARKNIKQLSFYEVSEMGTYVNDNGNVFNHVGNDHELLKKLKMTPQYEYLVNRFGWIRNIQENPLFWTISFSTICSKKLFSTNKLLKHYFGCPIETCKKLLENKESMASWRNQTRLDKSWKEMKKYLINIENITIPFLQSEYLFDTTLMAEALGKKVNCAWSPKRLKAEHDVWMKEYIDIILEFEPYRELNVAKIFKDFQAFSGYEMLTSNHDLIAEGQRMNHCVGMYSSYVDRGDSAIYRVNGHTLELRYSIDYNTNVNSNQKVLMVAQYNGYKNKPAPNELRLEVNAVISEFNKTLGVNYVDTVEVSKHDLPF